MLRASPSSESLRDAFRLETKRSQRQSDGTISLEGVRFEIPARYRHFREVTVRYARWDLGRVDLVDERSGTDSGSHLSPRQNRQRRRPPRPCGARQYRHGAGPGLKQRQRVAAAPEEHPPGVFGHGDAAGVPAQDADLPERRTIMNSKKLLALWGLKWNPFSPELPSEGLLVTPKIEHFAWRVEQLVQEGGFALITGESGTGKSVALRIVAGRLSALRDVTVGVIERPQSKSADFYRELGDIFAVKLAPHNRWGGFKALRERWKAHVASSRIRPVLLVDEAQEMSPEVLGELRILSSADFDATSLLTVVLSGDGRLLELLRQEDLVPLGTRIRTRLVTEAATREELLELLRHALAKAGNATLMTAELMDTLVDHSAGNYRLLMIMGGELLAYGMAHDVAQLDEKCYLEVFQPRQPTPRAQEESEGVTMPVSADQVLPVVRVGEIASDESAQRWLVEELWGAQFGWCDRRRPEVRQDVAGAGHGPERGHGHGVPGQVRRAGAGTGPGLPGRGRAAGRAGARRGNGPASRSRSRRSRRST